jgi:hypothetical protein
MDVGRDEQAQVLERFQAALENGDLEGLLAVLAPDVRVVADGGGVVRAARRPITGAKTVARLLARFGVLTGGIRIETAWINGAPALRLDPGGQFETALSLAVEGGRITRIFGIRNPEKLPPARGRRAGPVSERPACAGAVDQKTN